MNMTPENIGQDEIEEEPTKKIKNGTLSVLIVDDEKYIRDLLADLVRHNAHESETAVDGEDALVKLSQKRFDVVLTDIKMPRLDGYNLLKKVKEKHPETAVVVMTGYSQEFSVREALSLGAEEYLSKPFHTEEVMMVIERAHWRNQVKRKGANSYPIDD